MKVNYLITLLLLCTLSGYSQNKIYSDLTAAKSDGKPFQVLPLFTYSSDDLREIKISRETLASGILLDLNQKSLHTIVQNSPEKLTLIIPTSSNTSTKIDLLKHNIFAEGFFVSTNQEPKTAVKFDRGVHYKGIIQGDPNSVVSFSFFENEIYGLICNHEGNKVIGKAENDFTHRYLFYNDFNLTVQNPFDCSTADDNRGYTPSQLNRNGGNTTSALGDCINVYIEADDDLVTDKGGASNASSYITALFNQCITLYANETLSMAVSQIMCWVTPSPYSSATSTSALLAAFQSNTGTFNGDLSHLVSYRGGGGQAAGFSGICSADPDQSKCVSKVYSTYNNVPTYSWSVNVITHEMGHLIGSRHTHACVWNGNNTAIDGCAGYVEGSCALPGNPAGGGTIMSYCHLTSVGMNLSLGFGPQPGNVIRNTVLNATCLHNCGYSSCSDGFMNGDETGVDCGGSTCPVCPATCTTPTNVTVGSVSVTNAAISWSGVIGAVSYALDYKLNSSSTWIVASAAISNGTSFYLTGLTGGSLYDFRVRTNCASGNSAYYQSQFTTLTPAACYSNYEPNETMGAAAVIPASTTITATIGSASDLDYYKLTTSVTSDFNVNLTNLPDDYDLQMFNASGTSIGLSENANTTSENITLSALAAGTYYFFIYGYGGANSPTVCYNFNVGVTTTAGCTTPTGLTSSAITSTTATVSWSAVGSAVNYNVEYKLNSSPTWIVASTTTTTTSYNFTGLSVGSLYDYRIRANCTGGSSAYGQAQFTTSPACISAYEPNESQAAAVAIAVNTTISAGIYATGDLDFFKVTTTGISNFNVTLTGLPGDFDIQMLNSGGTVLATSQNGGTLSENIVLSNLAAGTYTFKVYGYSGANSATVCYNLYVGVSSVSSCNTPGTLSTGLITASSATFNWAAEAGATGYNIQYRIVGAPSWTAASSATNSYSVSGLSAFTDYEWQVQTVCTSGVSLFSSSVLFTTLCTTPSVTITASGSTTLCPGGSVLLTANPSIPVSTYQWLLNGTTIAAATASTYSASSAGNYSVQVTSGTCSSTSAITSISSAGVPTISSFSPSSGIIGATVTITGTNFINVSDVRFNSISATYIVNSTTSITATVPAGASTGLISVVTPCGTANSATNFTVVTNYSILVKVLIEGFYIGGGLMRAVVNPSIPSQCDSVTIQLARSTAPYSIDYSDKVIVSTSGIGTFHFPTSVIGGSYYLVVRHRNSLQTWSANPLTLNGFSTTYDFSSAASKAYGNNQFVQSDGKACIYSGDVNQDNSINAGDFAIINGNTGLFLTGYQVSDLTGDNCVEAADYSLIENHYNGISVSKP